MQHSLAVQLMYNINTIKNGSSNVPRSAARQAFAFASLSLMLPTKRYLVLALDRTVGWSEQLYLARDGDGGRREAESSSVVPHTHTLRLTGEEDNRGSTSHSENCQGQPT